MISDSRAAGAEEHQQHRYGWRKSHHSECRRNQVSVYKYPSAEETPQSKWVRGEIRLHISIPTFVNNLHLPRRWTINPTSYRYQHMEGL